VLTLRDGLAPDTTTAACSGGPGVVKAGTSSRIRPIDPKALQTARPQWMECKPAEMFTVLPVAKRSLRKR